MLAATAILLPFDLPVWAGGAALLALIYTAWVDARTGLVPPLPLIVAGLVVAVGWLVADLPRLPPQLMLAFAVYAAIWALNFIWHRLYKQDALGMGDASWSWLAAFAYGWQSLVVAWGAGAVIALLFLGSLHLAGRRARHVYFAPFLCVALLLSRYVLPV